MNIPNATAHRATGPLHAAVAGDVLVRGDHGYDEARRAWNLAVDQRPAAVVIAESAADVAQAVRFARARGMRIAPQGTGHGAGPLEPLDGAMLLRTARMRRVDIDPAARTARAEAGALWKDVTVPAGDGAFLADAPAAAIDAVAALAGPDADTRLASVEIRHLGGELARAASGGGAQPSIDAKYAMFAYGFTPTPELADAVRAHARAAKDALAPWHASYDYYNFAEIPAGASAVLPRDSYHRLQKIKATYDPGQAIIAIHPVWPARH